MARIGFIGCGQMARALAKGFLQAKIVSGDELSGSDVDPSCRRQFEELTGGKAAESNAKVAENCDVVILAVKPQTLDAVLEEIKPGIKETHLVVSIAAGVPISRIQGHLGPAPRVIRVMPNTPCLVGAGASGFALGTTATNEDARLVQSLLESVGIAFQLDEKLLDAVTGLSGSGPAYAYQMIEALSDGGVKAGLPRAAATALAAQTLYGAAKMVLETGKHPGELKDMVTSPAGTTIAGLAELEANGVRGAYISAVNVAAERSKALGK